MTQDNIKFYGELFKELGLTELRFTEKDSELVLKKEIQVNVAPQGVALNMDVLDTTSNSRENVVQGSGQNLDDNTEVKAPLVGVYYAAPSPEAEPFVKVGDIVKKGDVLCVIEAMKMFNEIKSEVSGRIVDICVDNGNIVEYGQTIIKIAEQ